MANTYTALVNPLTGVATGYYLKDGAYYAQDARGGYIPVGAGELKAGQSFGTPPGAVGNTGAPSPTNSSATTAVADNSGPSGPQTPPGGRVGPGGELLGPSRNAATDEQKLVDKIYGLTPTDYSGVYDTAFQNIGQPANGNHGNKTIEGVQALADAFVTRFHQKTNTLPSEEQVRQFVANNLTPGFASRMIAGINTDQIINSYVDPYIQDNANNLGIGGTGGDAQSRILSLNDQLDKAYEAGKNKFIQDTNDQYGAQKQGLVNDLAGQGMLTQPNSRVSLDALEAAKNKSIASGINTLAGQRAAGSVDLGKTIESLLQSQQQIGNQASQFNKTFNAGREDNYFNQGLQNRQLSLSDTLGRLQSNASKPGTLDYLGLAFKGLGALGSLGTGVANVANAF